jgi:hypothetical protein
MKDQGAGTLWRTGREIREPGEAIYLFIPRPFEVVE